jgi:hypothetical protein
MRILFSARLIPPELKREEPSLSWRRQLRTDEIFMISFSQYILFISKIKYKRNL